MALLDYDKLIAPLSGAACGPDLRAEPDFRDIEDAPGGFANLKAPDLKKTVKACNDLLERTKDQAPAIVALQAAVRYADFDEATTALRLIKGFAEEYWEQFHPGPAEEMLIGRINELTALTRPAAMTLPLQRAGLARLPAPSTVEFTAQMISQACEPTAEWSAKDESELQARVETGQMTSANARTMKPIREGGRTLRTFARMLSADARAEDLTAGITGSDDAGDAETQLRIGLSLRAQVEASTTALRVVSDLFYELAEVYQTKGGDSPNFGPIINQIKAMLIETDRFLEIFPSGLDDPEAEAVDADDTVGNEIAGSGGSKAVQKFTAGTPQSRDDVLAAMDAIGRYYDATEPTSPVPIMLRRVRAWIHKDFMELINEIAPSSVDEVRKLLARPDE